jgi:hypothetical protein
MTPFCPRFCAVALLLAMGGCASTPRPAQVAETAQHSTDPAVASSDAGPSGELERARRRQRARLEYYKRAWGIEIMSIKPVSSGYMLAFRYRVLDPVKAAPFNDRKAKAFLVDEATGTALAVPALENIGELRPGATPESDRAYFMIFGNPGQLVKSGSKVSLVIGNLRADGLIVE